MQVHGLMQIWSDDHGDFDNQIYDPLFKSREEAAKALAEQKQEEGSRWVLVHFHVV